MPFVKQLEPAGIRMVDRVSYRTENQVILHHHSTSRWLHFKNPYEVLEESSIEKILQALCHIEEKVRKHQLHAAGFLSYEASAAFDHALHTKCT